MDCSVVLWSVEQRLDKLVVCDHQVADSPPKEDKQNRHVLLRHRPKQNNI